MQSALLAGLKSARLGTVTACLMAGLVPWSSVRAQVTDKLGVRLPPSLDALTVDSLQLKGGNKTNGLVKLNGVGPSDKDIRVALSSNHPAVQVPAEVLLRGVAQKAFQLSTKAVSQPTTVVVSASFAGRRRQTAVTVVPASLRNPGHLPIPEQTISLPALDFTVSAVLYEAAGNVITRPTNPQDFKLCAAVGQVAGLVKIPTKVQYAYQHSRGFSQQVEIPVDPVDLNHPQVCRTIEGLEYGEYVDVTLTVDPANTTAESNETNNIHKLRVAR